MATTPSSSGGRGATTPLNKVERAHQLYREARYTEALAFYTDALTLAKTQLQKIALHSNRAACLLKLHDFDKAANECTSVLELDHKHTGALMLRAQTLVTLKEYHSAIFDVNRLLELNPSSEVYLNLQARLKTQLSLAPIPEAEEEDEDTSEDLSEVHEEWQEGRPDDQIVEYAVGKDVKDKWKSIGSGGLYSSEANSKTLPSSPPSNGWVSIPKPKGHSRLDYSRWDRVEDGSSEDDNDENDSEEEEEEAQPRYRFRVKNVDLRPVK